jgi:hypothetical protein
MPTRKRQLMVEIVQAIWLVVIVYILWNRG